MIHLVDRVPGANEKIVSNRSMMTVGGPATNAAITFSALGGESTLLTVVGDGALTAEQKTELDSHGIVTVDLARGTQRPGVVSTVLVSQSRGDRAVVSQVPSQHPEISKSDDWKLDDTRIVLVDGHNMDICLEVAQAASLRGIPVVMDGGSWKEGTEKLLPLVDFFIGSADFAFPGASGQVLDQLGDYGFELRAITHGGAPIEYVTKDEHGRLDVHASGAVVDTLGAGDILHGAFAFFLAQKEPVIRALKKAAEVATFSTRFFGPRDWIEYVSANQKWSPCKI